MFGLTRTPNQQPTRHATGADFCRIFEKNMNHLYVLSLLLTRNELAAEQCFVQGLADSKASNPVFHEWAESWARRTVVQNAIQMIRPRPRETVEPAPVVDGSSIERSAELAAILGLPTFDRFAYVLSVLEGYPLQECALLLDCSRSDVITARMRALQQVVKSLQAGSNVLTIQSAKQILPEGAEFDQFSPLAATA
jgi:hypothetical protein